MLLPSSLCILFQGRWLYKIRKIFLGAGRNSCGRERGKRTWSVRPDHKWNKNLIKCYAHTTTTRTTALSHQQDPRYDQITTRWRLLLLLLHYCSYSKPFLSARIYYTIPSGGSCIEQFCGYGHVSYINSSFLDRNFGMSIPDPDVICWASLLEYSYVSACVAKDYWFVRAIKPSLLFLCTRELY